MAGRIWSRASARGTPDISRSSIALTAFSLASTSPAAVATLRSRLAGLLTGRAYCPGFRWHAGAGLAPSSFVMKITAGSGAAGQARTAASALSTESSRPGKRWSTSSLRSRA